MGRTFTLAHAFYPFTGVGPFFHMHPRHRPAEIFATTNTPHFGANCQSDVSLPVIPQK